MTKKKKSQSEEFSSELGHHSPASEQEQVIKGLKALFQRKDKRKIREKQAEKTKKKNENE